MNGAAEWRSSMSDIEALSARIDALEIRLAYQDDTIETLNSTITDQWKRIDDLSRQITRLDGLIQEATDRQIPQEKPPHY
jgi:SlyX protein